MSTRQRRISNSGFTLTELLMVMAVVGIIAALLIVVTNKVLTHVRTVGCASNLRQVHTAVQLYANDHDGRLPSPCGMGQGPRYYYTSQNTTFNLACLLRDYLPAARREPEAGVNRWFNPIFACPGWIADGGQNLPNPGSSLSTSYILNLNPWPSWPGANKFYPFGSTNDAQDGGVTHKIVELNRFPLDRTWMMVDADNTFARDALRWSGWSHWLEISVHGEYHNVLFYDGHVEGITTPEFTRFP